MTVPATCDGAGTAEVPPRLAAMVDRMLCLLDRAGASVVETGRPCGRRLAVGLGLLCVFPLILLATPHVFVVRWHKDAFIPLEAGWRFINGQVPHIDYYSPLGWLYPALHGWAMQIFGVSAMALIQANLLIMPVVVGAGLLATSGGRLSVWPRLGLVAALGLAVLSPRFADGSVVEIVHLANYNRHGWALATIVLVAALIEPTRRSPARSAAETAMLTGLTLALFYLKITFFAWAGLGLMLAVLLVPANRAVAFFGGAGALAVLAACTAASDLNIGYFHDILQAKASFGGTYGLTERAPGFRKLLGDLWQNVGSLSAIVVIGVWLLRSADGVAERRAARAATLAVMLLAASALAINNQNHQHHLFGLLALLLILLGATVRRAEARQGVAARRAAAGVAALSLIVTAPQVVKDGLAIPLNVLLPLVSPTVKATAIAGTPIDDLMLVAVQNRRKETSRPLTLVMSGELSAEAHEAFELQLTGADVQLLLDDGHRMLSAHAPGATVLSVSFSSWFSFFTGTRPPVGGGLWWHYGRTFSENSPPDADRLLADADVVMLPRFREFDDTEAMWKLIGDAVRARYDIAAQSPLWTLWKKRPDMALNEGGVK